MAGIHADHGLAGREGVVGVKLVRSGGVALKTETEHLALDRVAVILPVDRLGNNAVERFDETRPKYSPIFRQAMPCCTQKSRTSFSGLASVQLSRSIGWEKYVGLKSRPMPFSRA